MVFNRIKSSMGGLLKYTSISAVALTLDYSTYIFFLGLGFEAPISSIIGYLTGLILAYFLMKNRVFKDGWLESKKHLEFVGFVVSGIWGVFLTYLTVSATCALIPDAVYLAKINAVLVSFVGVYLFRRFVVFRKLQ